MWVLVFFFANVWNVGGVGDNGQLLCGSGGGGYGGGGGGNGGAVPLVFSYRTGGGGGGSYSSCPSDKATPVILPSSNNGKIMLTMSFSAPSPPTLSHFYWSDATFPTTQLFSNHIVVGKIISHSERSNVLINP